VINTKDSDGGTILRLYTNITDLPLKNYIDGTVNGNLSAIIKTGICGDEYLLLGAWEEIKNQYAEAIGDHSFKLYLSLLKEINRLSLIIDQVALCVEMLRLVYTDWFATELRNILNATINFDVKDKEGYEATLKNCLSRSKGFKIQLDLKMMQFEGINKKEKGGAVADHAYYQSLLIALSDHVGYPITDNITVFEFANRIKRLNHDIERMEKERRK